MRKLQFLVVASGASNASNKALLSDWFSAALQTSRKARRYALKKG
jgi:hypothetical protein